MIAIGRHELAGVIAQPGTVTLRTGPKFVMGPFSLGLVCPFSISESCPASSGQFGKGYLSGCHQSEPVGRPLVHFCGAFRTGKIIARFELKARTE